MAYNHSFVQLEGFLYISFLVKIYFFRVSIIVVKLIAVNIIKNVLIAVITGDLEIDVGDAVIVVFDAETVENRDCKKVLEAIIIGPVPLGDNVTITSVGFCVSVITTVGCSVLN